MAPLPIETHSGSDIVLSNFHYSGDFNPGDAYVPSLRSSFGEESLILSIGPLRMRLEGLSRLQAEALRDDFAPFVTGREGAPDVTVTLRRAEVAGFLGAPRPDRPEIYRMKSRSVGDRLTLWSYEFAGCLESRSRRALLALVEEEGELHRRGLENFLRVLTACFILGHDGLLLHASAVVRGGSAHVFFGPSGSGKTTVTDLSARDIVLSDDLTLIVRQPEGYAAAGIPFGLAHHRVPQTSASFPIASLNRLVQDRRVAREPLTGARALAEVAGSLPFVMQEAGQADRAMAVAARLLAVVPAYRLRFRKDDSFWSAVQEG
jgi:hypothetical protein